MTPAALKKYLLSLPATTVEVQWGEHEVYKIGGKMFAITWPGTPSLRFKCADDSFEILTQMEGVIPAPYLARAKWVSLDRWSRLSDDDLKGYLRRAHEIVAAKLPSKQRLALFGPDPKKF